jgi:hypothetical protein
LKLLERSAAAVYGSHGVGDVLDKQLHFSTPGALSKPKVRVGETAATVDDAGEPRPWYLGDRPPVCGSANA